jgi:hypothetical protein
MRILKLVSFYDANTGAVTIGTSGSYCNATFDENKQGFGLMGQRKSCGFGFFLEPGLAVRRIPPGWLWRRNQVRYAQPFSAPASTG